MANSFFINWQDPLTRRWHPVAQLWRTEHRYVFAYLRGALSSQQFRPFAGLSDVRGVYLSPELFPIFSNRMLSERRPEYRTYANWSGLGEGTDPLLLMARMEGSRATDTLQVHPVPERTAEGLFRTAFFCHAIRHMPEAAQDRVERLRDGERLFPLFDLQNPHDDEAVALRTSDPTSMIGYVPRYLAGDFRRLAVDANNRFNISVSRVNHGAPAQFRLLCDAVSRWPEGFKAQDDDEHSTICRFSIEDVAWDLRQHANLPSHRAYPT